MSLSYVDTSAVMKLLVAEIETPALIAELLSGRRDLVSSWLLHTELHCAAGRHRDAIDIAEVNKVLGAITLVDLTRGDLIVAGAQTPLRSNDAIHLAVALRLGVDDILTYDAELARAATAAGLCVVAPS